MAFFTLPSQSEVKVATEISIDGLSEITLESSFTKESTSMIRDSDSFEIPSQSGVRTDVTSCDRLLLAKEGFPFNAPEPPETSPASLWNATEDPTLPMDEDSLAARVCDRRPLVECRQCVPPDEFAMASTADFSIKRFTPDVEQRSVYNSELDATWFPINDPAFPNTSTGSYSTTGYPTLIQSECQNYDNRLEKFFHAINVEYDAKAQTVSGLLYAQCGVSNSKKCMDWFNAKPVKMDCIRGEAGDAEPNELRPARPARFPYYRVGTWLAYRLFVADGTEDDNYAPKGCGASIDKVTLAVHQKNETWVNQ